MTFCIFCGSPLSTSLSCPMCGKSHERRQGAVDWTISKRHHRASAHVAENGSAVRSASVMRALLGPLTGQGWTVDLGGSALSTWEVSSLMLAHFSLLLALGDGLLALYRVMTLPASWLIWTALTPFFLIWAIRSFCHLTVGAWRASDAPARFHWIGASGTLAGLMVALGNVPTPPSWVALGSCIAWGWCAAEWMRSLLA